MVVVVPSALRMVAVTRIFRFVGRTPNVQRLTVVGGSPTERLGGSDAGPTYMMQPGPATGAARKPGRSELSGPAMPFSAASKIRAVL